MRKVRILFFSGSVGLGHVARDLVIANELRRQYPNVEISWLAVPPAAQILEEAREKVLPEAKFCSNMNRSIENVLRSGHHLNLISYLREARKEWKQNVEVFQGVTEREWFDLTIGDETYEIVMALKKNPTSKSTPFIFIVDFIGLASMGSTLKEKLGVYLLNRVWASDYHHATRVKDLTLFVGELEDVPDKSFGFLLPNRRDYAKRTCEFVGYILPFRPSDYTDTSKIRHKLGYRDDPLIVCSVGGTAVGKEILELCGQAYPLVKQRIPNVRMVLVTGPRLSTGSLHVTQGVEVAGYVPRLYEHFAASDMAVVQGSGTTTLELTALRKPFIYFPLEGHYEQEVVVAERLQRHRAGVKMMFAHTTPQALAENILANLGIEVNYSSIPLDGAQKAVQLISRFV